MPADKPLPNRVCHLVPTLIYDRYQVVRGYETVIEDAPIETLHALRIDCKRLRYSLEFFREVLGPEAKDVIREVVIIQDHLGDLHDADVACSLLVGFLGEGYGVGTTLRDESHCASETGPLHHRLSDAHTRIVNTHTVRANEMEVSLASPFCKNPLESNTLFGICLGKT